MACESPSPSSPDSYSWLLSPITPESFNASYFEQAVCVVRRSKPEYHRHLVSLTDLDSLLGSRSAIHPDVTLVNANREIAVDEFVGRGGALDPVRVARLFSEGATVIFTQMHARFSRLSELCATLGSELSCRTQTNLYLTPPNAQGFSPHWDSHDVFVLQVFGSKNWEIYENGLKLPLPGQQFSAAEQQTGEVEQEFVLQAGDFAYIPRGVTHAASSKGEPSLHVTLGLVPLTWADVLLECVAKAAIDDVEFRHSLPSGFARRHATGEMQTLFDQKAARLTEYLARNVELRELTEGLLPFPKQSHERVLAQVCAVGTITGASEVRRRPNVLWDLRVETDRCVIVQGDREIRFPAHVEPALRALSEHTWLRTHSLPDCLDEDGKLVLVKRLVAEGLLEVVDSSAASGLESAQGGGV